MDLNQTALEDVGYKVRSQAVMAPVERRYDGEGDGEIPLGVIVGR